MYKTCPKCGHHQSEGAARAKECEACGLVFSKWLKNLAAEFAEAEISLERNPPLSIGERMLNFLFPPHPHIGRMEFGLCAAMFVVFLFWGTHFILLDFRTDEIGQSFLHNVNLIFHEAGHIIFMPGGRFMGILGGSLLQVLVPIVVCVAFLVVNHDGFAASMGLWWVGQSLMDLAPYIADARALRLPLLGGGTGADRPGMHDWNNILRDIGWLAHDERIATIVHYTGAGLMVVSFAWGAIMLRLYFLSVDKP